MLRSSNTSEVALSTKDEKVINDLEDLAGWEIGEDGALATAGRMLSWLMNDVLNYSNSSIVDRHFKAKPHSSESSFTAFASSSAYSAVRYDRSFNVYRNIAAMITGAAVAQGNQAQAKLGYDIGKKIVKQRAHIGAIAILDACHMSLYPDPLLDDDGQTLLEKASNIYQSQGVRYPLATANMADKKRFEKISTRFNEEGFLDIEGKFELAEKTGRGKNPKFKIFQKVVRQLTNSATNTIETVYALQKAMEYFMPDPDFLITNSDVRFIPKFAITINKILSGEDTSVARDPRSQYLNLLIDRLRGFDIASETTNYLVDVSAIAKKEQEIAR